MIGQNRARAVTARFASLRFAVIGDAMLDEFIWGRVSRISPEAPVPVVEVQKEETYPGGAANVARNLRDLGCAVRLLGRIGRDAAGERLTGVLAAEGVDTSGLVRSTETPTIVKTRVIARSQQVVRFDRERRAPLHAAEFAGFEQAMATALPEVDAVIVEDYAKGLLDQRAVDAIAAACAGAGRLWTVDPNPGNPVRWHGATAMKPNRAEAFAAAGELPDDDPAAVERVGRRLLDVWRTGLVLMTLGEHGIRLFGADGTDFASATRAREVFDVSGAGDTTIAVFTAALAAGAVPAEAAELANHAAGIVVGKLGTATTTTAEIVESFRDE